MAELLEVIMIVSFGASWPLNVIKSHKARTAKGDIPEGAIVIRSIVSSPLADRVAEYYGVTMKAVLTGFKYIGGEILQLE